MKIYKVYFNLLINCGGIIKVIDSSITVPAESEQEAKEIFKSTVKFDPHIQEVKERKL